MKTNFYKYKVIQEKMFKEGMEAAEARMQIQAKDRKYCGNEYVTKIQKHDGKCVYQMREEVVEEILRYLIVISEAVERVYSWEGLGNKPKDTSPTQRAIMYFIAGTKPDEAYFQSIKRCYQGSPMMSFYRDEEAQAEQEKYEQERKRIQDLWSSF
ncbi:MAG: hypothetical protein IJW06_00675 [Clostridia bacterium]|nr:hypothetical protein [Clostridia bacterium]